MGYLEKLAEIKSFAGPRVTDGLDKALIATLLSQFPSLAEAIDQAYDYWLEVKENSPELLKMAEEEQIKFLQQDITNFYSDHSKNPYVAIGAKGPWVITSCGAVIHDSGGYGMLGMGHDPEAVINAMGKHQVMANVMTASLSQRNFTEKLKKHIGFKRPDKRTFHSYIFVNSGSEAVSVAARFSDLNANVLTKPGARHHGKEIKLLSHRGSFHGRTHRPAQASDSSMKIYREFLPSFRVRNNLITTPINDINALEKNFADAENQGVFIEMMLIEPVMGEGNPGMGVTPEFYKRARELTKNMGSLLLVDSIQAGIRTHGCLSIIDYPGFENLELPDMETYSKALNAGQYPMSVLALTKATSELYQSGVYGNTMTGNPRALDVGCAVLDLLTPELQTNIQQKGKEFLKKLRVVQEEFPSAITNVQGTGLLFSVEINPKFCEVVGANGIERQLRLKGIGVIHGGPNSLRFTPHFSITSDEVDLIVRQLKTVIRSNLG